MDLKATISADIVASTALSEGSMLILNESVRRCIKEIEMHFPSTWGRLVKGDSIEIFTDSPRSALRTALMLKVFVKSLSLEKSPEAERFRRSAVRIAIGIGTMRIVNKDIDYMDGEAIYLSGRALARSGKGDLLVIAGSPAETHPEINVMASLANNLINHSRAYPCSLMYHKLLGMAQKDIAKTAGVSEPAVSQALRAAGWDSLYSFISYYENLTFI